MADSLLQRAYELDDESVRQLAMEKWGVDTSPAEARQMLVTDAGLVQELTPHLSGEDISKFRSLIAPGMSGKPILTLADVKSIVPAVQGGYSVDEIVSGFGQRRARGLEGYVGPQLHRTNTQKQAIQQQSSTSAAAPAAAPAATSPDVGVPFIEDTGVAHGPGYGTHITQQAKSPVHYQDIPFVEDTGAAYGPGYGTHITQQAKFAVNPQIQAQGASSQSPETSININPLETQGGYYRDPWYNPDVSNTIQIGTPGANVRAPQRIMAGYDPRDGRYARGYYVDQYGNVTVPYDRQYLQYIDPYGRIPRSVYANAPNRDPRWHWSVMNAEDQMLRQAGGLYLDKIEAAFDRMVNGLGEGPSLYQPQPGTIQNRPYERQDAGWMIQPLFKMPTRRVSDGKIVEGSGESEGETSTNAIMDDAGVPVALQNIGRNVYFQMLAQGYDEWTATRTALKAMMDADSGFNGDAYLRAAMAQAGGVSDNPQYNHINNLGWEGSAVQAQKKTSEVS